MRAIVMPTSSREYVLSYEADFRPIRILGLIVGGIAGPLIEYMAFAGKMPLQQGQSAGILDVLFGAMFGLPFVLILIFCLFGSSGTTINKDEMSCRRWWSLLGAKVGTPQSIKGLSCICISKEYQPRYSVSMGTVAVCAVHLGQNGPAVAWYYDHAEAERKAAELADYFGLPVTDLSQSAPVNIVAKSAPANIVPPSAKLARFATQHPRHRVLRFVFSLINYLIVLALVYALKFALEGRNQAMYQSDMQPRTADSLVIKLPPEKQKISPDDLKFGEQQVDHMLADRPQMSSFVTKGDAVYEWSARRFGGIACGERIAWNPGELNNKPGGYTSEAQYPGCIQKNPEGCIRIREFDQSGKPHPGQFLWAKAVFELFNIGSGRKFAKVYNDVNEGKLTKEEFIDRMTLLEYQNNKRQHNFYHNVWVPFLTQKGIKPESSGWWTAKMPAFEDWKASWKKDGYPYDVYGTYYDRQKNRQE